MILIIVEAFPCIFEIPSSCDFSARYKIQEFGGRGGCRGSGLVLLVFLDVTAMRVDMEDAERNW